MHGRRELEERGKAPHKHYHQAISRRLLELQVEEKKLEEKWEQMRLNCRDNHDKTYWKVGDNVIDMEGEGSDKWAWVGTIKELRDWEDRIRGGSARKFGLTIQANLYITSSGTNKPIQYEDVDQRIKQRWDLAVNDTPVTRKLVYQIMLVANEIRDLSEKLRQ